jgi:hypothetical protein
MFLNGLFRPFRPFQQTNIKTKHINSMGAGVSFFSTSKKEAYTGSTTSVSLVSLFSSISPAQAGLSPEEILNKQKEQEKIGQFVVDHFFYAIPIITRKKSRKEPLCPVWIEPQPEIVEQSLSGQFPEGQVQGFFKLDIFVN